MNNNELLNVILEDVQCTDILTNDIILEYDTSEKGKSFFELFGKSQAYTTCQQSITNYVRNLNKCKTKADVERLYNKEFETTEKQCESFKKQVDRFKELGRDDKSKFEKEGIYTNKGFKVTFAKSLAIGVIGGVGAMFNPTIAVGAMTAGYVIGMMNVISDQAGGIYMYHKWLQGEGKTITNKVKAKLK